MPTLMKLRKNFRDKDFALILVSADEPELITTKVQPMLKDFGVDFITYITHESSDEAFIAGISPEWNGALPTSFLYNKEGKLVDMIIGSKTYEQFEEGVVKLLR